LALPILWLALVHVPKQVELGNNHPNFACATFGISWLIFPFFANAQYAKAHLDSGYLNETQRNERQRASQGANRQEVKSHTSSSVADELAKLAALKVQVCLVMKSSTTRNSNYCLSA
jgi:hypothetical protein